MIESIVDYNWRSMCQNYFTLWGGVISLAWRTVQLRNIKQKTSKNWTGLKMLHVIFFFFFFSIYVEGLHNFSISFFHSLSPNSHFSNPILITCISFSVISGSGTVWLLADLLYIPAVSPFSAGHIAKHVLTLASLGSGVGLPSLPLCSPSLPTLHASHARGHASVSVIFPSTFFYTNGNTLRPKI